MDICCFVSIRPFDKSVCKSLAETFALDLYGRALNMENELVQVCCT